MNIGVKQRFFLGVLGGWTLRRGSQSLSSDPPEKNICFFFQGWGRQAKPCLPALAPQPPRLEAGGLNLKARGLNLKVQPPRTPQDLGKKTIVFFLTKVKIWLCCWNCFLQVALVKNSGKPKKNLWKKNNCFFLGARGGRQNLACPPSPGKKKQLFFSGGQTSRSAPLPS